MGALSQHEAVEHVQLPQDQTFKKQTRGSEIEWSQPKKGLKGMGKVWHVVAGICAMLSLATLATFMGMPATGRATTRSTHTGKPALFLERQTREVYITGK